MISVCGRVSQSALVAFTCSLWMIGHIVGEKFFFLKVYCIVYICVWLCVYACRYERWELPNVDAGNPAFVLWKNSKCSRAIAKPSLQPQVGKRFMMGMEIIACLFKHLNTYAYTPLQSASTNSNNLK